MKIISLLFGIILSINGFSQDLQRPKLVVGIVVDQMRWDYLYRYYNRYAANGGFKRLLNQGFSCENTMIPYTPTVTAAGHASIYTGSVPAINGITGNNWWDKEKGRSVYCTDDDSVRSVGTTSSWGKMSPRNLLVTTICDELRLATNFQSKVIGIALKDRGCIFPAGRTPNAVYWYDEATGSWISSTYYMDDLPQWVKDFNSKKSVDKYYAQGWNTLYPINTYTQSTADVKPYENRVFGINAQGFPYDLKDFAGKNYTTFISTPFGNTLTADFAKSAITNENMGTDDITDFLALSFKSPDYIGHAFGPNSIEVEDTYLRLDKDLGELFAFLDSKIGKDQYTVFLSADHGVVNVPGFSKEHNIPAGTADATSMTRAINSLLKNKYNRNDLVITILNSQVYLNYAGIDSAHGNADEIKKMIIDFLVNQPSVARAFEIDKLSETTLNDNVKKMLANGYYPKRCGDIQLIIQPQYLEYFSTRGTSHGSMYPYDAHIPLLWYGWGINQGKLNRETYMTDIAPTLAALLHIQMPSGSVGKVITEVIK